jgi:hypothetical protein
MCFMSWTVSTSPPPSLCALCPVLPCVALCCAVLRYSGPGCSECALGFASTSNGCVFLPKVTGNCSDGVMNNNEAGVDCGGPHCATPCAKAIVIDNTPGSGSHGSNALSAGASVGACPLECTWPAHAHLYSSRSHAFQRLNQCILPHPRHYSYNSLTSPLLPPLLSPSPSLLAVPLLSHPPVAPAWCSFHAGVAVGALVAVVLTVMAVRANMAATKAREEAKKRRKSGGVEDKTATDKDGAAPEGPSQAVKPEDRRGSVRLPHQSSAQIRGF